MSEYQYVIFRAIDGPLSAENLEFMRDQSSRAEITPWSFTNEYHYGDFRGDREEMLRRGYDIHLHYANFGIRALCIRLPLSFPNPVAAQQYLDNESLTFNKDKHGPGGTLSIEPYYEAGHLDEIWDIEELLDRLVPLRTELQEGDLRPLYLAYVAVHRDFNHNPEEETEAPVPAGLNELSDAQQALVEFYEIPKSLIAAAADQSARLPSGRSAAEQHLPWIQSVPESVRNAWLAEVMVSPRSAAAVRLQMQEQFRQRHAAAAWPTTNAGRSLAELETQAAEIQHDWDKSAAVQEAEERTRRLAEIAVEPKRYLRDVENLVAQRSMDTYAAAAQLLAEVRQALTDTDEAGLAESFAQQLRKKYPKRHHMTAALRKHGFLPK